MAKYTAQAFIQMAKRVLDPYAYHKNRKGEIDSTPEKTSIAGDDVLLIEDSGDGMAKKRVKVSSFTFGSTDAQAVHVNASGEINAVLGKGSPVGTDKLLIEDSQDSWRKKSIQLTNLPTPAHTHQISDVTGLQNALDGKEPVINPKGSAFNRDFGTTAGTVAEGNHNHDGSYAAVSHNHVIADVTGLQSALDGKEPVISPKGTAFNKNFGANAGEVAEGNHNHDASYEPIIGPKGTAFNKDFGTGAGQVAEGNHNHDGTYEPVIGPKGTAFNKNFGVNAGEVAEGNHNHDASYAPLVHTHAIADVTGLQAALDSKVETSSNQGTGAGIALPKNGTDLPFRSIVAGQGMWVSELADNITLDAQVYLVDTGSNLFPVYQDTYRGNKQLSVETMLTSYVRNGSSGNGGSVTFSQAIDPQSGWVSHIASTVVAFSVSWESASTTGNPVDLIIEDVVSGTIYATVSTGELTNGANRVMGTVLTTNIDLPLNAIIGCRLVTTAGTITDKRVNLYTRWRF